MTGMVKRLLTLVLVPVLVISFTSVVLAAFTPSGTEVAIPTESSNTATVNVAHLAPFASAEISTSVTVRLNGVDALTDFTFGEIAAGVVLTSGDYLIEILPTGTSVVAISGTVNVTDGVNYTLAAIGDGVKQPLELFPMVDDTVVPVTGAKVRIAHLAPFDDMDTAVDICTDDGNVVVGNVPYKVFTDPYLALPAGDYDLLIALAGTNCETVALDVPSVRVADGDIVDVFAVGGANNWPLQVTSITGLTFTPAQVNVAHFAPFADGAANTSVTVRVNGVDTFTNFEFPATVAAELPPGDYLIEVLPTGTSTVAISGTVMLEAGGDYTLAAIGDGANQPLELFPLINDTVVPTTGAKLRIAHLAPFDDVDTAVDICTDDGNVVVGNVPYKVFTDPYLALPAGDYDLLIALAGTNCETVALDIPSVRLAEGEIADVFAIGGANNWPLQVTSISGLTFTPAPVTVAHFAPFAEGAANTSVTVRIDGADAISDFEFGNVVETELPAGTYLIEILPTGTETVAISGTVTISVGNEYTLAAIGDGSNQGLELLPLVDDTTLPMMDMGRVRVAHLAPFAATGTEVDICAGETAVLSGVPYKGVTDPYLELPAGAYNLNVTAAGSSCQTVLFSVAFSLEAGDIGSVYAIGGANGFAAQGLVSNSILFRIFLPIVFNN